MNKENIKDATFVVSHETHGVGVTVPGQIYDDGTVDVMFDAGIIKGVSMDDLDVVES